jgi:hypothetical protein
MEDLTGQKFGRLEVKEFAFKQNQYPIWNCLCDCGKTKEVRGSSLKNGNTKSCGCLQKEQTTRANTTHGQTQNGLISREYNCWHHMIERCNNPKIKQYKDYGGRGIKVCEHWLKFENFYNDMGDCPEDMTLDRKDNNGDYTPENCRWVTRKEQQNNMRSNIFLSYNGITDTLIHWADKLNIKSGILYHRYYREWSEQRMLSTPGKEYRRVLV